MKLPEREKELYKAMHDVGRYAKQIVSTIVLADEYLVGEEVINKNPQSMFKLILGGNGWRIRKCAESSDDFRLHISYDWRDRTYSFYNVGNGLKTALYSVMPSLTAEQIYAKTLALLKKNIRDISSDSKLAKETLRNNERETKNAKSLINIVDELSRR